MTKLLPKNTKTDTPITKTQSELNPKPQSTRECAVIVITGQKRVGKSFNILKEIDLQIKLNRNVLIFDINGEYTKFQTIEPSPNEIMKLAQLKNSQVRRILALKKDGSPMSNKEKMQTVKTIIQYFRNGLAVFDDLDKYATFSQDQDMISMLMGNAHIGLDVLITHQSMSKISTSEAQNAQFLRLHKQKGSVSNLNPEKFADAELIEIGYGVVEEQYNLGNIRFFCIIDRDKGVVRGVSKQAFLRSAQRYLLRNTHIVNTKINELKALSLTQGHTGDNLYKYASQQCLNDLLREYHPEVKKI